jgi:acetyl esterase
MSENTLPRAEHPEVAALLDELAASGRPSSRTLPLPEGRRNFAEQFEPFTAYPEVGAVADTVIPVDGREVPVRVYRPDEPVRAGASVFLHGGGWVFGDLRSHDGMCRSITSGSGITTVAVDYRRAPEHPFPAAVEDAAGEALLYPATDPAMNTESYRENADDPFLSRDEMVWYWSQYGGGTVPADPRAALSAVTDLRGLPPAYLLVAEFDPLRDEGLAFGEALRRAGVPVRCSEYPDMPHGFLLFAGRLSRAAQALSEVADEVAAGLGSR